MSPGPIVTSLVVAEEQELFRVNVLHIDWQWRHNTCCRVGGLGQPECCQEADCHVLVFFVQRRPLSLKLCWPRGIRRSSDGMTISWGRLRRLLGVGRNRCCSASRVKIVHSMSPQTKWWSTRVRHHSVETIAKSTFSLVPALTVAFKPDVPALLYLAGTSDFGELMSFASGTSK